MTTDAQKTAEVTEHANHVFGRMRANPRQRKVRRKRVTNYLKPKPAKDWFSGVEAALPPGDRD